MSKSIVLRIISSRRSCGCRGWVVVNAKGDQVLPSEGFYGTKRLARKELERYFRRSLKGVDPLE